MQPLYTPLVDCPAVASDQHSDASLAVPQSHLHDRLDPLLEVGLVVDIVPATTRSFMNGMSLSSRIW